MGQFVSHLHFAKPIFLFFLLLLPLLWLRWQKQLSAVSLWRSIIYFLLVLALADAEWLDNVKVSEIGGDERIFAFDLSRSVPTPMRRWMERAAKEKLSPSKKDRIFVFAGGTLEVQDWDQWVRGAKSAEPIQPNRTNLENLFSVLSGLPEKPRNVFLFTDGWENEGAVESLLPSLASSGMKVFPLLPPDRPVVANVAVKKVLTPSEANGGDKINLKVLVENLNDREVEGSLTLRHNGQPFKSETIKITPGSHIFNYQTTLPEGPMVSFQASLISRRPESDLFPQDNQATAWVAVRTKDRVLLLNGHAGEGRYLEMLLKRRGFQVDSVIPNGSTPSAAGYGLVIFNNVERERFSRNYLTTIERHVGGGNGFLMLGDEGSFGPGGYMQTPIETILPVELREPKKEEKNRAVILVIDKSGSMREENKILYAKEAAKAVIGRLKDNDLLGVVGFDIEPFVVVPLAPVEKIRGTFASQIDRLRASGRTYVYPAIVEAKRQLERQSAGRKHVIILSDGITGGAQGDYVDLASVMRKELKITISAVAIGDDADIALMKRIAQYGGGLFHHAFDPTTLPQIVLHQMEENSEDRPKQRDFIPVQGRGSELLEGFHERSYPSLKGYIETELKRGAHLDLMIPTDNRRSPLLASWNYGKGKAVAFTTDMTGRWSRDWIQWAALERFWGKVFEWLRPPKESLPPHEVKINLFKDRPVLDLYLYDERTDSSLFRYSSTGKEGKKEGLLEKLAPGHYQSTLPISTPGDYRIELIEERQGRRISYPPLGYTLTFDPKSELPREQFNIPLLEQLARVTGGEINPKRVEKPKEQEKTMRASRPLRVFFILLASIFFLLEIVFRRFFFHLGT